jgi:activator of 2-hydroxyglutaryl-CoA dehydratase
MVVGIDIGSTTTKSVAIYPDKTFKTLTTRAFDPITSATGALGKMLMLNNLEIGSIKHRGGSFRNPYLKNRGN